MEATKKRNIKSGSEYDKLFPKSEGDNKTIRRNANVTHTVSFIPKVVSETLNQTEAIARRLKGSSVYETCSNIWHFVYQHINYKKDEEGYEQIRSPARSWHDRFQGVDCDCYSTFISSILTNLGITHLLRITKYQKDYFQHIYPVVKNGNREIIIDCVTDKFDYEVPYSEKKDYPMDLQYLNGFDGDGMEELGKIVKRNMAKNKSASLPKAAKKIKTKSNLKKATSSGSSVPPVKKKKKGILKKVVSKINKINPATILLRNGVLVSMKLNIKNVAGRLRWSYLTPEQAAAKGIILEKFQKLVATRQKLENIFTVAGGKVDNLRKAILGGKGNKDKAVNGLGMLPMIEWSGYMNEYTPLDQILGPETYYSENIEGMEGLGQLGEPITLTSIAAAAGVIAGIVSALKQVGDIFGGKGKGTEDFDESKTDAPENNVNSASTNSSAQLPDTTNNSIIPNNSSSETFDEKSSQETNSSNALVKTSDTNSSTEVDESNETGVTTTKANSVSTTSDDSKDDTGTTPPDEKQTFWDKNKTWLKPVAIGVGGLTLIAVGFHLMKGKAQNKSSPPHSLSGVPHKKKKKKKNHHRSHKTKHHHKKAVALL
jgi:hypothetical protein